MLIISVIISVFGGRVSSYPNFKKFMHSMRLTRRTCQQGQPWSIQTKWRKQMASSLGKSKAGLPHFHHPLKKYWHFFSYHLIRPNYWALLWYKNKSVSFHCMLSLASMSPFKQGSKPTLSYHVHEPTVTTMPHTFHLDPKMDHFEKWPRFACLLFSIPCRMLRKGVDPW